MAFVQSLKWSSLRPLLFFQNRAWSDFDEFAECLKKCTDEKAQKKWVFTHFYETKVGVKNRMYFLKTALFRCFLPILGRFAQIHREKNWKSPLAHFYSLLIVIKRLKNIYK